MEQKRIPLIAIKASKNNPRKRFDGLAELAASFEHNKERPGEPYSMPIVTYDGGSSYVIVDGERRVRAMKEAGKLTDCLCLVANSLDDLDVVSMMVATDNKSSLTDDELAQGVQMMLFFGADADEAYDVAGRRKNMPAKAIRSIAPRLRGRAQPTQLSFKALVDAAEVEDDEKLNTLLDLADRDEKAFQRELSEVLNRQRIERYHDEIEQALKHHGVEFVTEKPEGSFMFLRRVSHWNQDKVQAVADALKSIASMESVSGDDVVCVLRPAGEIGNVWDVSAEFGVRVSEEESEEEKAQRERREKVEKTKGDVEAIMESMNLWLKENLDVMTVALNDETLDRDLSMEVFQYAWNSLYVIADVTMEDVILASPHRKFSPLVAAAGYAAFMDDITPRNVAGVIEGEYGDAESVDDAGKLVSMINVMSDAGRDVSDGERHVIVRIDKAIQAVRDAEAGDQDE